MQATAKDDGHFEQILWRTLDILDVTFLFSEKNGLLFFQSQSTQLSITQYLFNMSLILFYLIVQSFQLL